MMRKATFTHDATSGAATMSLPCQFCGTTVTGRGAGKCNTTVGFSAFCKKCGATTTGTQHLACGK